MRVNVRQLKDNLSLYDIEKLIESLDIPITSKSNKIWSLKSGCHSKDCNCDSNLKFYPETMTFTCFSHNCLNGNDIIDLITQRQSLFDENWEFVNSINFIIDTLDISVEKLTETNHKSNKFDYNGFFKRYLKHTNNDIIELNSYNDSVLSYFKNDIYSKSFIDENISIDTMNKFEVGYYKYKQQIIFPVRDIKGNLIGIRVRNTNPEIVKTQKYMPLNLDGEIFNFPSSSTLYGLYQNSENIKKTKTVYLFEGEKSVLKFEDIEKTNNAVATFGTHFGTFQRQLLLNLGVENVYICYDKQFEEYEGDEFDRYINTINKVVKNMQGYFNVFIIYDNNDLLDYKDSPVDEGKKVWNDLKKNCIRM